MADTSPPGTTLFTVAVSLAVALLAAVVMLRGGRPTNAVPTSFQVLFVAGAVGVWWSAWRLRLPFLTLWAGIALHVEQGGASPAVNSILTAAQTAIAVALLVLCTRLRLPDAVPVPMAPRPVADSVLA